MALVHARLSHPDCRSKGWLLDGFPTTRAQALAMQESGLLADIFLLIDVPELALMDRVADRKVDPITGRVYNAKTAPPPSDHSVSFLFRVCVPQMPHLTLLPPYSCKAAW